MLIGYLAGKVLPGTDRLKSTWVAAGAGAPDLPLILVASYCWAIAGFPMPATADIDGFVGLVDQFYFESGPFIAMHHMLHAPGSLLFLSLFCLVFGKIFAKSVARACWFLAGAATHCFVDLFTHAGDGMLILWPINWSYRFDAGVDQWNMQGTGALVLTAEIALFVICGGYLFCVRSRPFFSFLTLPMDGTLRKPALA